MVVRKQIRSAHSSQCNCDASKVEAECKQAQHAQPSRLSHGYPSIASVLVRAGASGEEDRDKGPPAAVQRFACIGS